MVNGKHTVVSLFCRCGGSSLGYKWAGYKELLAVDFDKDCADAFRANFPEVPCWKRDVKKVAGREILEFCGIAKGELDLLDASPPCQGFSMAGRREVADPRNDLFLEFVRLVRQTAPRAFVMENVAGMARGRMRGRFNEVMAELRGTGYRVKCKLVNAKWYGVPQSRQRLVWIGARSDLGVEPGFPSWMTPRPITVAETLFADGAIKNVMHKNKWRPAGLPSPTLTASQRPIVMIESHAGYKDSRFRVVSGPSQTLTAGRRPRIFIGERHSPEVLRAWQESRRFIGSFHSKRLKPGRPAPTVIAGVKNWHPEEPRYLTVDEAKAIQSFPPDFKVDSYKLIGNAVPPRLMEAIARAVKESVLDHAPTP
jgi:DNA (cytosine-5)-methyltransferase 1